MRTAPFVPVVDSGFSLREPRNDGGVGERGVDFRALLCINSYVMEPFAFISRDLARELHAQARKVPKLRRIPHPAETMVAVRQLVEKTTLPYRTIAARTGVSLATVSRHARAGGWLRPDATYGEEHYTEEGRRRLRRQALAERMLKLAENLAYITDMNPSATQNRIRRVVQLVKMSKDLDEIERRPARRKPRKTSKEAPPAP